MSNPDTLELVQYTFNEVGVIESIEDRNYNLQARSKQTELLYLYGFTDGVLEATKGDTMICSATTRYTALQVSEGTVKIANQIFRREAGPALDLSLNNLILNGNDEKTLRMQVYYEDVDVNELGHARSSGQAFQRQHKACFKWVTSSDSKLSAGTDLGDGQILIGEIDIVTHPTDEWFQGEDTDPFNTDSRDICLAKFRPENSEEILNDLQTHEAVLKIIQKDIGTMDTNDQLSDYDEESGDRSLIARLDAVEKDIGTMDVAGDLTDYDEATNNSIIARLEIEDVTEISGSDAETVSSYQLRYYKDRGRVYFDGYVIGDGSKALSHFETALITTLPTGYRPSTIQYFIPSGYALEDTLWAFSNDAIFSISTDGKVNMQFIRISDDNITRTWLLDGISFRVA